MAQASIRSLILEVNEVNVAKGRKFLCVEAKGFPPLYGVVLQVAAPWKGFDQGALRAHP